MTNEEIIALQNAVGAPYVKLLEYLRAPVDRGGYEGYGPDQLHINAANAVGELIVGLASQIEISNDLRVQLYTISPQTVVQAEPSEEWEYSCQYEYHNVFEEVWVLLSFGRTESEAREIMDERVGKERYRNVYIVRRAPGRPAGEWQRVGGTE